MPALKDRVGLNLTRFEPTDNPKNPPPPRSTGGPNPFIRCPLPPLNVNADTLRQFDESGAVPTRRVIPLPIPTVVGSGSSGSSGSTIVNTTSSSATGGGGVTPSAKLSATSVVLSVPALTPNGTYKITASMAKSFQLLQLISTQPIEVRMYSTATAQGADISRVTDTPVATETVSGLISDIVLDTTPYAWNWQNRIAANADIVQSTNIYLTIVNPSSTAGVSASTVTIVYLPLES